MTEYIERDKVYEILNSLLNDICDSTETSEEFDVGWETALERANDKINDIFAADVRPERHGEWVWNPNGMDWNLGAWQCSECCGNGNFSCNPHINPHIFVGSNYCSNCGAKMDGKDV